MGFSCIDAMKNLKLRFNIVSLTLKKKLFYAGQKF